MGRRCCCGCDLFSYSDILTDAVTGDTRVGQTSTITIGGDDYTVVDKQLPAGGLWLAEWDAIFTGDLLGNQQELKNSLARRR